MEPNWQLARKQKTLIQRARIIHKIRAFFVEKQFLEIETPQRIPANAPELHIDAFPSNDWFLHTSPELCMKRLLAAGYDNLFQICHCWRAGERSNTHLPEYTMLEWYRREHDYQQLMVDCEALLLHLLPEEQISYQGTLIDFVTPWQRITVADAFTRYGSMSLSAALKNNKYNDVMALEIEPNLPRDKPIFMIEYPVEHASLARTKPDDPKIAERFELYIGGIELANAFSELTDSVEQKQRFADEEFQRRNAGKPPYPSPELFLRELEVLNQATGIALGIDRLVMLLCDKDNIEEVVSFVPEQL